MMKKLFTILFLLSVSILGHSQTFPKAGATWIFDTGFFPWMDANAQKWEYTGETTTPQGILKSFSVTTKFVNPGSFPSDTTIISNETRQFLYVGDTIWNTNDMTSPIANFSLQLGDSSYTPYHTAYNINDSVIWQNCTEDSLILFQKGVVAEVGTETVDGIPSRYYVLSFVSEMNMPETAKFTERSIVNAGYWKFNRYNTCISIVEATNYYLVCFFDEASPAPVCSENQWFETLNIEEYESWNGKLYPNPTSDLLIVTNPENENVNARIIDIHGREIKNNIRLNPMSQISIDLSELASGMYVLQVQFPNGKTADKKFTVAK